MNTYRRPVELFVFGTCALVLSKALLSFVFVPDDFLNEGNPAWRMVLTASYVCVAMVLVPWYRETLFVLRRNPVLVALTLLAMISFLWAYNPDLVLRKSIGLLGTTLFGVALAVRFSFEEQLRLLSWLLRIAAVLSLACVFLLPAYGISREGEWEGIFAYKNSLGSMMGLSLLIESQLPTPTRLSKVLRLFAMLLSGVLLFFSNSVTPAFSFIGAFALLQIYKFAALRLRIPLFAMALSALALLTVGGAWFYANGDALTGIFGRSANLTGRTEIWSLVVSFIPQHPILGYGYSGFWLGASPESEIVNRVMGGWVMYSHNGFLETQLTLGIVGLLLTLALLWVGAKRALAFSKQPASSMSLWPLSFLLFFLLHNLGECTILIQDLEWAMCVACIAGSDPLLCTFETEVEEGIPWIPAEEPI